MRNYVQIWATTAFTSDDSGNLRSFNCISAFWETMQDVVLFNFRRNGYDDGFHSYPYYDGPTPLWCQLSKETVVFLLQQNDAAWNGEEYRSNLNFILNESPKLNDIPTFLEEILYLGEPVSPQ